MNAQAGRPGRGRHRCCLAGPRLPRCAHTQRFVYDRSVGGRLSQGWGFDRASVHPRQCHQRLPAAARLPLRVEPACTNPGPPPDFAGRGSRGAGRPTWVVRWEGSNSWALIRTTMSIPPSGRTTPLRPRSAAIQWRYNGGSTASRRRHLNSPSADRGGTDAAGHGEPATRLVRVRQPPKLNAPESRPTLPASPVNPAALLLDAARSWDADLLVLGRSDVGRVGPAYVGAVTRGVMEFSEAPVLVVPRPA